MTKSPYDAYIHLLVVMIMLEGWFLYMSNNLILLCGGRSMNQISVFDVADFFLSKDSMTPKKLQKLTYYAEAWHQALLEDCLIKDESFQAWVHGPVAPKLYREYRDYGWNPIPKKEETAMDFSEQSLSILESVWETYGDQDGNSLEALTHSELPWRNARVGLAPNENSNVVISIDDMKNYYKSIYIGG